MRWREIRLKALRASIPSQIWVVELGTLGGGGSHTEGGSHSRAPRRNRIGTNRKNAGKDFEDLALNLCGIKNQKRTYFEYSTWNCKITFHTIWGWDIFLIFDCGKLMTYIFSFMTCCSYKVSVHTKFLGGTSLWTVVLTHLILFSQLYNGSTFFATNTPSLGWLGLTTSSPDGLSLSCGTLVEEIAPDLFEFWSISEHWSGIFSVTIDLNADQTNFTESKNEKVEEFIYTYVSDSMRERRNEDKATSIFPYLHGATKHKYKTNLLADGPSMGISVASVRFVSGLRKIMLIM